MILQINMPVVQSVNLEKDMFVLNVEKNITSSSTLLCLRFMDLINIRYNKSPNINNNAIGCVNSNNINEISNK